MDEKDEYRRYAVRYKNEKIKSRNLSEKKRRDQFNMLISELCSMVTSSTRKMDKSSVLRSTISFLKNHSELSVQSHNVQMQENWKPSFLSSEEFAHLMLEALDGFIIVFSSNGQILYTSESASSLLGYLPSCIYSSVFDIIHELDKSSLIKMISNIPSNVNNSLSKDSFISLLLHMKRGPIHSQSNSAYELVHLIGTFYQWTAYEGKSTNDFECDTNSCTSISSPKTAFEWYSCFIAICRLQMPHLLRIVNLPEDTKNEFISRHSLEWKFLYLDHRAPPIIGYLPFEVLGTSGYDYYHIDDLDNIIACHESLMQSGEGTSCYYRFLTKGQQWIWLQTRYFISYHQWNAKPEFIVCTHTIISTEKVLKNIGKTVPKVCKKTFSKMTRTSPSKQSVCLSSSSSLSSHGSPASVDTSEWNFGKYSCENASSPPYVQPLPSTTLPEENFSKIDAHSTFIHQNEQISSNTLFNPLTKMNSQSTDEVANVSSVVNELNRIANTPRVRRPSTSTIQYEKEEIQPINQIQVHDYLRRRHQILQQQILQQQEELKRVSEQLMLVQFILPSTAANEINSQISNSEVHLNSTHINACSIAAPSFYLHLPIATSSENSIIKNMEDSLCPVEPSNPSNSYLNFEQPYLETVDSSEVSSPHIFMEQNNEDTTQSYKEPHIYNNM